VQVEEFSAAGLDLTCVDMSGASKYRGFWETYYRESDAVVYVIDSAGAYLPPFPLRTFVYVRTSHVASILISVLTLFFSSSPCSDEIRMAVVENELQALLEHGDLPPGIPVLVFANKKDLPTSLPPVNIAQRLKLTEKFRSRPWQIMHTNALTGEGLTEGMTWIGQMASPGQRR